MVHPPPKSLSELMGNHRSAVVLLSRAPTDRREFPLHRKLLAQKTSGMHCCIPDRITPVYPAKLPLLFFGFLCNHSILLSTYSKSSASNASGARIQSQCIEIEQSLVKKKVNV